MNEFQKCRLLSDKIKENKTSIFRFNIMGSIMIFIFTILFIGTFIGAIGSFISNTTSYSLLTAYIIQFVLYIIFIVNKIDFSGNNLDFNVDNNPIRSLDYNMNETTKVLKRKTIKFYIFTFFYFINFIVIIYGIGTQFA